MKNEELRYFSFKSDLEYNDELHEYRRGGVVLTSTTTLLKEAGIIDTRFYTESGAENGKRRHLLTEYFDKGILDWSSVIEEDLPYLEAWIQFKIDKKITISHIEQQMYHELLGYSGTIDRLVLIDGEPYVLDIKTGQPAKWHQLQLTLYGMMVTERPKLIAVYLQKNNKYKTRIYDYDERTAMSVVRINQWKRK